MDHEDQIIVITQTHGSNSKQEARVYDDMNDYIRELAHDSATTSDDWHYWHDENADGTVTVSEARHGEEVERTMSLEEFNCGDDEHNRRNEFYLDWAGHDLRTHQVLPVGDVITLAAENAPRGSIEDICYDALVQLVSESR